MLAVVVSLLMAYARRLSDNLGAAFAVRLASMGYAIPGVVMTELTDDGVVHAVDALRGYREG